MISADEKDSWLGNYDSNLDSRSQSPVVGTDLAALFFKMALNGQLNVQIVSREFQNGYRRAFSAFESLSTQNGRPLQGRPFAFRVSPSSAKTREKNRDDLK